VDLEEERTRSLTQLAHQDRLIAHHGDHSLDHRRPSRSGRHEQNQHGQQSEQKSSEHHRGGLV
jgi:hypothetical protein